MMSAEDAVAIALRAIEQVEAVAAETGNFNLGQAALKAKRELREWQQESSTGAPRGATEH